MHSFEQVMIEKSRKHRHRNRAAETTFRAKYRLDVQNLELVDPDHIGDRQTWSFDLPAGK